MRNGDIRLCKRRDNDEAGRYLGCWGVILMDSGFGEGEEVFVERLENSRYIDLDLDSWEECADHLDKHDSEQFFLRGGDEWW